LATVSAEPSVWFQATTFTGKLWPKRIHTAVGIKMWATSIWRAWKASAICDQPRNRVGFGASSPSAA
jgi:hypothetical protein